MVLMVMMMVPPNMGETIIITISLVCIGFG